MGAIYEDELLATAAGAGNSTWAALWPCLALVCRTVTSTEMRTDSTLHEGLSALFEKDGPVDTLGLASGDSSVAAHLIVGRIEPDNKGATQFLQWDPHIKLLPALSSSASAEEPLCSPEGRLALVRNCGGVMRCDATNSSFCVGIWVESAESWTSKTANLIKSHKGMAHLLEVLKQNPIKLCPD